MLLLWGYLLLLLLCVCVCVNDFWIVVLEGVWLWSFDVLCVVIYLFIYSVLLLWGYLLLLLYCCCRLVLSLRLSIKKAHTFERRRHEIDQQRY